ncbi:hypothetical protein IAT38_001547 [Cryptococcus sp. DSM 104549]
MMEEFVVDLTGAPSPRTSPVIIDDDTLPDIHDDISSGGKSPTPALSDGAPLSIDEKFPHTPDNNILVITQDGIGFYAPARVLQLIGYLTDACSFLNFKSVEQLGAQPDGRQRGIQLPCTRHRSRGLRFVLWYLFTRTTPPCPWECPVYGWSGMAAAVGHLRELQHAVEVADGLMVRSMDSLLDFLQRPSFSWDFENNVFAEYAFAAWVNDHYAVQDLPRKSMDYCIDDVPPEYLDLFSFRPSRSYTFRYFETLKEQHAAKRAAHCRLYDLWSDGDILPIPTFTVPYAPRQRVRGEPCAMCGDMGKRLQTWREVASHTAFQMVHRTADGPGALFGIKEAIVSLVSCRECGDMLAHAFEKVWQDDYDARESSTNRSKPNS